MITLYFYARFREKLGKDKESLDYPERDLTVQDLLDLLAERGGVWADLFGCDAVMVAIDQELVSRQTAVYDGDEVSLFPPTMGG